MAFLFPYVKGKQQDTCRGSGSSSSTAAYLPYKYMSVYILLNKYLYETLAISCKNIEYIYTLFIYFLLPANADRGRCVYGLIGVLCALPPHSLPLFPFSHYFQYASAADCLRLLCFRFGNWPVLFIYAYLKVMPSRLGLACLGLAVLGLLKPSASLVFRLCHETLAPDGTEQNSWHWSWPEGAWPAARVLH